MLDKRYLGVLILLPLIPIMYIGGDLVYILSLILSLIGLKEFYSVMKVKDYKPIAGIGYLFTLIYYLIVYLNPSFSQTSFVILGIALILFCIPVISIKYNFVDIGITILSLIYVPIMFSFLPLVSAMHNGKYLGWFVFIACWCTDSAAWAVGKHFGKIKIAPKVSPKKTVEGSIGGLVGSAIGSLIFGLIINNQITYVMPLYHYIILGIIVGVVSQFGDMFASSIKRTLGVKDYGDLIPGHGGILDRFDSILFGATVVFYYVNFIFHI